MTAEKAIGIALQAVLTIGAVYVQLLLACWIFMHRWRFPAGFLGHEPIAVMAMCAIETHLVGLAIRDADLR